MSAIKVKKEKVLVSVAVLILIVGCLAAAALTISTLAAYPSLIEEAYKSPLQKVSIPGEAEVELRRKGAYAVYYETAKGATDRRPSLACSLISNATGDEVPLVPDYVPTNRYDTKDDRVGVLVFSTTIPEPGFYELSCKDPDQVGEAGVVLAIGPNYYFEFLQLAWNLGKSLLGGAGVLCGSVVFSIGFVSLAIISAKNRREVG